MSHLLQVTEANHTRDEFYTLGGAGFESEAERAEEIAKLPRDLGPHSCETGNRCYLVDVLDGEDGFSVLESIEVTEETAHALLGIEDFEPIRQAQDAAVAGLLAESGSEAKHGE